MKDRACEEAGAGKILLVSGSSGLFSLSAEDIVAGTGVPTVNYGVHAGLKLDYLLKRADSAVQEGDLVVLSIEYELFQRVEDPSYTLVEYVSRHDPAYFRGLSIHQKLKFLLYFDLVDFFRRLRSPADQMEFGVRESPSLTRLGDHRRNDPAMRTPDQRIAVDSANPVRLRLEEDGRAFSLIRGYAQKWRVRGAQVVHIFPQTIHFPHYSKAEYSEAFDWIGDGMISAGIPTLGMPVDFMAGPDAFFDTGYHANSDGRTVFSARLIELLNASSYLEHFD